MKIIPEKIAITAPKERTKFIHHKVHPVPPPNSEIKDKIRKRYERERIKIEKLLTLGYTTSGDP